MATNFQDASGEIRLVGTIYAPGATPGDVFTVQANGSLAPAAAAVSGVSSVTDGNTTVDPATSLDFTSGATVTDGGSGVAQVAVSGGSQPVQAIYSAVSTTAIANNDGANLPWDTLDDGVELLDRTDPANPLVLAAGTYAITVSTNCAALTAGGSVEVALFSTPVSKTQGSTVPNRIVTVGWTAILPAGDSIGVFVSNHDGASSRDFGFSNAVIVKLA